MLYASYKNKQAQIVAIHNLALSLRCGLPRSPCGSLAMTDKESTLCYFAMTAHHCHLELPIESEKSKKFRKFKKIKILKTKIQKFRKFKKPKKYKNLENLKKIQKNPKIHTDFTQKFYNHTRKFYLRRKL